MIQNILKPVYHLLLIVHHLDCKSKTEPHSARHFYPLWCNKNYAILTMTKWNLDKLNLASFPFDQNSCLHVTKKISFGERNSIFLVFLTKKFRSTRFTPQFWKFFGNFPRNFYMTNHPCFKFQNVWLNRKFTSKFYWLTAYTGNV